MLIVIADIIKQVCCLILVIPMVAIMSLKELWKESKPVGLIDGIVSYFYH